MANYHPTSARTTVNRPFEERVEPRGSTTHGLMSARVAHHSEERSAANRHLACGKQARPRREGMGKTKIHSKGKREHSHIWQ
jgi:hypothetical protein